MKKHKKFLLMFLLGFVILALLAISFGKTPISSLANSNTTSWLPLIFAGSDSTLQEEYIVIGWNDLGMHCYDQEYSVLSLLPPYNTIWAQVIQVGDPPQIITDTVTVEFSFPDNAESASKTNFWDYDEVLFGVDLPLNIGLKGFGLSGDMDLSEQGSYFIAEGIPLTEYNDSAPFSSDPYQLAHLVVRDSITDEILAKTTIVAPVSSEMRCDKCHNEEDQHNFRRDILLVHDEENGTKLTSQADAGNPVLCAKCHADPALDMPGEPDIPPLSIAIHKQHDEETQDCYDCHPGNQTQCLRDVMSQPPTNYWCTNCHGDMLDVADENRTPWMDEPRCGTCHEAQYSENPGTLYRFSTGHGGLYCESCHNSTHAILPSSEARDNLQSIALQGYEGTIGKCTVCHLTEPESGGPHVTP
jgi:hypothetical protein